MNDFAKRRLVNTSGLIAVTALSWLALTVLDASIRATPFWSGWTLFAVIVSLAGFNARKKLPFIPLGKASSWMQFHLYAGIFSIFVYLAHAGPKLPSGTLEASLCLLFVSIALSGVVGAVVSRVVPVGLTTRGEPVLFERIASLRMVLHEEVEALVVEAAREHQTTTISDFYKENLDGFFRGPQNLVFHLMGWSKPIRELEREFDAMDRYLNEREREVVLLIRERTRLKDDLDYQWARQLLLKGWLFVHIPLTFSLLILVVLHIVVVYGFRGNLP
ncbi:MAG: hypothetical protein ACI8W3_001646 [Myxococcota bacterium]